MTLDELVWAGIGATLGVLFCLLMLYYNHRTQLRWYLFLKPRIEPRPTQETDHG